MRGTGRVCDAILSEEVAGGDGGIKREQVFCMIKVFPLDRIEEGLSQLLLSERQHERKTVIVKFQA